MFFNKDKKNKEESMESESSSISNSPFKSEERKARGSFSPKRGRPFLVKESGSNSDIRPNKTFGPKRTASRGATRLRAGGAGEVEVIPLGGLEEIGKNSMIIKYGEEMVLVDVGLTFPDHTMPGVDVVLPDFSYVNKNAKNLNAILLTHGHEDHIGAISHFFRNFPNKNVPIYGSSFTLGLVRGKLNEHWGKRKYNLNEVKGRDRVKVSPNIEVEFVDITHSIPQAFCLAIHTPAGTIVHTGDYKFDLTPINNRYADFYSLASLGEKGALLLLSDSTNSPKEEFTPSERLLKGSFEKILRKAEGRVIVASFSSHAHRVQQLVDVAYQFGRKTALDGKSMMKCSEVGLSTEEVKFPTGALVPVNKINTMPANKAMVVCTGTQGEEMSALTRMSRGAHKDIKIKPGDTVIISATFIPGNERAIIDVINNLMKRGAEVIYEKHHGMHVSGHGARGDIRLMLNLIRPKFFMPVHGEFINLKNNKELAMEYGIPEENIVLTKNGDRVLVSNDEIKVKGSVESGVVMVEGGNSGGVEDGTINERKQLANEGLVIVNATFDKKKRVIVDSPEILTKGVSIKKFDFLMKDISMAVKEEFLVPAEVMDIHVLRKAIRDKVVSFLRRNHKNSLVIPMVNLI